VSKHAAIRRLLLGLDVLTLVASMVIAYGMQRALHGVLPVLKSPAPLARFLFVGYLTLPLWVFLVWAFGLHRVFERVFSLADVVVGLVKLHVVGVMGLALIAFLTQVEINRSVVGLFVVASFVSMTTVRWLLSRWVQWQHVTGRGRERVLLVGDAGPELRQFVRHTARSPLPPVIVGYLSPDVARDPDGAERSAPPGASVPPLVGQASTLRQILHEQAVDQVVFFPPLSDPGGCIDAVLACEELGVTAAFAVGRAGVLSTPPRVLSVYETPVVAYVVSTKDPSLLSLKQAFDVVGAVLLVIALSPLLVGVALAIALSMGRPVLYTQERVGLNGRRFRMFKFRSMVRGAEGMKPEVSHLNETGGPTFKTRRDPRVTSLGRFLRRFSIDELPQLLNVLEGSMSLVGPRPLPVDEQQQIRGAQRRRLSMKPGITGLWQVSGRSDVGFEDWMRLDVKYVDEWSLALDLALLLRTVKVVIVGRGAR
jgi:exopolysaccharide biosynthesis polyprenyl glycosylphosphotransferase